MYRFFVIATITLLFFVASSAQIQPASNLQHLLIQAELDPSVFRQAKQLAIDRHLPISIQLPSGTIMYPTGVEYNRPVYAIITNTLHPFEGGYTAFYEEIERQYDFSSAKISFGGKEKEMTSASLKHSLSNTALLLVPDWTADRVWAFDPITGDLVDTAFIRSNSTSLASPKQALEHPLHKFVTVSDQITDLVQKFNPDSGTWLGWFAPAGGINNSILDNIRGHAYRPNNNLLVTVASGTNSQSIAQFDTGGNYIGNFIGQGVGGLNSPFDILIRENDILISQSSAPTGVKQYDLDGTYLSQWATITSFPQQIFRMSDGRIAVANFSGTGNTGIRIYDANGNFLRLLSGVTGNRGVYQLPSGNFLTTNSTGIHEIDSTTGNLVRTIQTGTNFQYINLYTPGGGLVGTKTIPGDYPTIATAIADLDTQGVGTGGVTFNVAAGHTETFSNPTVGTITATGTQTNQIIFQKSGTGDNPLITAALNGTSTAIDGIIKIVSGDYITFDAIDVQENSGNTDPTTQMEWGYALVKNDSSDGCWHVTIKNSTITLNKANTNSSGIYSGNHGPTSTTPSFTLTDSLGTVRYCKFYDNTISNVYWGLRINGSTVAAFYDQYNEIGVDGGNTISNYGGSTASAYGMEIQYQNNLKIANNTVNGGGPTHTGILYGIRTGSGTNSNVDIYNNTVTLAQGTTSTNLLYAIVNSTGSTGIDNTVNIYNNIVENCTHLNSTSNSVWLIYNLASAFNVNIFGNVVRNNTKGAGTGPVHCVYNSPVSPSVNAQIYDNEVYNNSSAGPIHGVHITSGTNTSIFRNQIYNVRSTSTTTAFATAGITVAGTTSGPVDVSIYNNFISDLRAANSAAVDAVRGINITSTTANSNRGVYYNTIYLNAVSGGANFGTTGIYHTYNATTTTSALDMRNNIIVNISTPNGTGKTGAFRRSAATNLNNYSALSNNNCLFAGTPGVGNVIFFDGTNFDQTLEAYQSRVAPRDAASISVIPPFVNSATSPYDLHIDSTVATPIDSGATPIAGITDDFNGDLRDSNYPDIGADEFRSVITGVVEPGEPTEFRLSQNYPNPFNPTTQIQYGLPKVSFVTLKVYNVLGQEVVSLVNGEQRAGYATVMWDGRNSLGNMVSGGMYFYRIEARPTSGGEVFTQVKKMLMIK